MAEAKPSTRAARHFSPPPSERREGLILRRGLEEWRFMTPRFVLLAVGGGLLTATGVFSAHGSWFGRLFAAALVLTVAYALGTEITESFRRDHWDAIQRHEDLLRRMTHFVTSVGLGEVDAKTLARLNWASRPNPRLPLRSDEDDFVLLTEAWNFWEDGFDEQALTKCTVCDRPRSEHSVGGDCPPDTESHANC